MKPDSDMLTLDADAAVNEREDKRACLYRDALIVLARNLAPSKLWPAKDLTARATSLNRRKSSRGRALHVDPAHAVLRRAQPKMALAATGATFEVTGKGDPVVVWRLDKLGRWLSDFAVLVRERERHALGTSIFEERSHTVVRARRSALQVLEALAQLESDLIDEVPRGPTSSRSRQSAEGLYRRNRAVPAGGTVY